ncbi:MAG: hypothetical protein RL430_812 [Actinomycetota bacterium]|jgi:hypothetical protein|nr:hypothetical protein [Actinomycetota bacterium]
MFSSGSKYLLGISGLSLVAAIVYAFTVNPSDLGVIAILGLMVAAGLLVGIGLKNNDGDAATIEEAVAASAEAPRDSAWPAVFALGLALTAVGLATVPVVFLLGIVALVAGGAEWLITNWADRASVDRRYNNDVVRVKTIGPLEYPVAAAVVLGVVAYLFSRVMLTVSKETAPIVFIAVGTVVLVIGFLAGTRPSFRGKPLVASISVVVLALVVAGVTTGIQGERAELAEASAGDFYDASHRECGAEESEHFDHHAGNTVNLRASVLATVFVKDGKAYAELIGMPKPTDTITIARSNAVNILFRNLDEKEYRMVMHLGEAKVGTTGTVEKVETCTQLAGKNQEQLLTVTIPKPSAAFKDGYSIEVPGAEGVIKVMVP